MQNCMNFYKKCSMNIFIWLISLKGNENLWFKNAYGPVKQINEVKDKRLNESCFCVLLPRSIDKGEAISGRSPLPCRYSEVTKHKNNSRLTFCPLLHLSASQG